VALPERPGVRQRHRPDSQHCGLQVEALHIERRAELPGFGHEPVVGVVEYRDGRVIDLIRRTPG